MRIGLVCPYDLGKPGGVQQIVVGLGRLLAEAGEEVLLIAPGRTGQDPALPFQSVGTSMSIRANKSAVPLALSPSTWARTRAALSLVDLAHVHEPFIPIVGWAAVTARDVPIVATFHADPPTWARTSYKGLAPAGRLALGDVVLTATSRVSASAIPGAWGEPLIVPNGIDVASFRLQTDRHPKRVAFLGRDDPRKGLSVLLEAWPAVRARHPDAELDVMGAIRDDRIPGVAFHGTADEATKRQVLASSQIFVAPNLGGESFGIVIAEAMAAGCAVIASDIEAFRDVVGEAGVLIPPGDSVALSSSISRLLDDPGESRRLGGLALESVQRFDWSTVLSGYREAYSEALS